ncbi:MAG: sulfatase-like hydrolase/transferase [Planctomycetota bacterium]|jgi:arylsulfatase A-like enzyme
MMRGKRKWHLIFPALLAAALPWLMAACSEGSRSKPNVLLITLDTTRADHIGCYGRKPGLTPAIDGLAKRGVRFARCVAPAPITLPSHVSILTGQYPIRHGVRDNSVYYLTDEATTLAEALGEAGYRTGASVSAVAVSHRFGIAQGFEVFEEGGLIVMDSQVLEGGLVERDGAEVTAETIAFLKSSKGHEKPFFYWSHYFDPHEPYNWHLDIDPGPANTPYEAEIRYVDHQTGRILDALEEFGLDSNTIVVVTADHGEGLGQHNEHSHLLLTYETTLAVPLIMAGPGIAQGKEEEKCLSRLIDLMPTILDLVDAKPPSARQLDGVSLAPFLSEGASSEAGPEFAYFETLGPVSFDWAPLDGVTTLEWKYIRGPTDELYNLIADPGELNELQDRHPDVLASLSRATDTYATILSETGAECDLAGRQSEIFGALGYLSLDARARRPSRDAPHPRDMVSISRVLQDALSYQRVGQFKEALGQYEECVRLSPGTAMFHDFAAKMKRRLMDHEGSIESWRNALAINPDMIDVRLLLGIALENAGDLKGAEEELREVIRRAPKMRQGYGYLANLLHMQDRYRDELEVLEAMLANVDFEDGDEELIFRRQKRQLQGMLGKE